MREHDTLLAAKGLYDLGFAVHWVRPKSKKPVESKWTTGDRKPWAELKRTFKPGMNVGVRLGKASKLATGYLAVLDCDVKSADPKHRKEMLARLMEVCNQPTPYVASGRGNGSSHRYVVTEAPAAPKRLAQSPDKVRCLMPSVEPTPLETRTLSEKELNDGWRIRPAWEISLMGEGQHVVLPPSRHPDTGNRYEWKAPVTAATDFHSFKAVAATSSTGKKAGKFVPVAVDLVASNLPNDILEAIRDGEGVTDRSGELLRVTCSMLRNGFTDAEILTVLTDRENYLGSVGYEHAETEDRARAAEWIRRYTLEKAKKDTLAAMQFDDAVEEETLEEWEVEAQAAEMKRERDESDDWRDAIERSSPEHGGRPKNTFQNVQIILEGETSPEIFRLDEFAHSEICTVDTPWGSKAGQEMVDIDTLRIMDWIGKRHRFEPSKDKIDDAISCISDRNRFHPVRDYLSGLKWDGVPRIDTWLETYLGATGPRAYVRAIGRKTLVAMVKRVFQPGCKFDHVLILEGNQGEGKSTTLKNLAGPEWFTDAKVDMSGDKDTVLALRSIWVSELGELSGMRNAEVDSLKEFISRTTDRIRVPYGRKAENFPRQCVFIGTTNRDEYLKDPTGNRRFWPVKVGRCDFEAVARDRDQLFAEAVFAYELGEPLYLEDDDMERGAKREQDARTQGDPIEEQIRDWLVKEEDDAGQPVEKENIFLLDLFKDFGPLTNMKPDMHTMRRAGEALRKIGYTRKLVKQWGFVRRLWVKAG